MKKNTVKRLASLFLTLMMLVGVLAVEPSTVTAATKPSIKLNQTKNTIYAGEITTLKVSKTTGLKSKAVTYKSSNTKIATVTSKGVVKAKKSGKVTITATSKSNKKIKAKCKITVKKAPSTKKITLGSINGSVAIGKKAQIVVNSIEGVSSKKLTYTSSDESIATVDDKGGVMGVGEGTAQITVKAVCNPKVKATYTITVLKTMKYLDYEDFDVSELKDVGLLDTGKVYTNFMDYAKAGGKYTYFVRYKTENNDGDWKTFKTARGIKIGSTKAEVEAAYAGVYYISEGLFTGDNTAEHIHTSNQRYCGENIWTSIMFVYDQNDIVMSIRYCPR